MFLPFLLSLIAVAIGLAAFLLTGLGPARWIQRRTGLPMAVLFPLVWVVNALVGYAVFFCFLLGRLPGYVAAAIFLIGLSAFTIRSWRQGVFSGISGRWVKRWIALLAVAMLFFCGLLWTASPTPRFVETVQTRYFQHLLTGDHLIPLWLANYTLDERWGKPDTGQDALQGWLLGDRPPSQTGIYLLYHGLYQLCGLPSTAAYQALGMVFQLGWLPGFFLLASRTLGPRRAGPAVALVIGLGMMVVNTAFVWPKMVCGGFIATALALLLYRRPGRDLLILALAAASFGLAMLSHGGALFSAPAFGLLFLMRWRGRLWQGFTVGIGVAIILLGPWTAFQKLVAPPANNLLKWHLAGQRDVDRRGLTEAIQEAYADRSLADSMQARWENIATLYQHPTNQLVFGEGWLDSWRRIQFYQVIPSGGFLLLGLLAWLAAFFIRRDGAFEMWLRAGYTGPLCWAGWALWIALLFEGGETLTTHGSYGNLFLWFLFLIAGLMAAGRFWALGVLALQVAAFLLLWWYPGGTLAMTQGASWFWLPSLLALVSYSLLIWQFGFSKIWRWGGVPVWTQAVALPHSERNNEMG